jgi:hypothetical protein
LLVLDVDIYTLPLMQSIYRQPNGGVNGAIAGFFGCLCCCFLLL